MLGGVKCLCFLESTHVFEHFDIKYSFWQKKWSLCYWTFDMLYVYELHIAWCDAVSRFLELFILHLNEVKASFQYTYHLAWPCILWDALIPVYGIKDIVQDVEISRTLNGHSINCCWENKVHRFWKKKTYIFSSSSIFCKSVSSCPNMPYSFLEHETKNAEVQESRPRCSRCLELHSK